ADYPVGGSLRLLLSGFSRPVNVANPAEITIKQFAQEIIKLTGTKQKIVDKPLPQDDPMQRQPDITLAKKLLKWTPKVERAEGMRRTFAYFKSLTPEELNEKEHMDFGKYTRR